MFWTNWWRWGHFWVRFEVMDVEWVSFGWWWRGRLRGTIWFKLIESVEGSQSRTPPPNLHPLTQHKFKLKIVHSKCHPLPQFLVKIEITIWLMTKTKEKKNRRIYLSALFTEDDLTNGNSIPISVNLLWNKSKLNFDNDVGVPFHHHWLWAYHK